MDLELLHDSSDDSSSQSENEASGGYDCEFVTAPPAAFQTECPVCLQILKEPCVIDCRCGKKFCRECVERIKSANKPCPMCNKTDFSFMRDYGLERSLKEFDVWCSNKKNGCGWRGRLGEFEEHLNKYPSPDNKLDGCQFVEVECVHGCGGQFLRNEVARHQNEECQKRPYSCEYCREYNSTFEDVTEIHHSQCRKYPVVCPNKCGEAPFERQEVESHVKDKCPLTEVECPLHYAGCEVKLPRKDMPDHMKDTATHLTLLANVTKSLLRENQELKQSIEEKHKATEKEVKILKEETHRLKLKLGASSGFPIDFCVNYANKETVYLPPFYTHSCGYRMCFCVCPNGDGDGKGTHVSIFTYLMRGSYDDQLKWPFRGEITIQIVNQAGDHCHVEMTIPYDDETPDECAGRVTGKERGGGWGLHKFLAHTDLQYNAAKGTQYVKDDIIIVRVVHIKITQ